MFDISRRDELCESNLFLEKSQGFVELVPAKDGAICTSAMLGYIKAMKANLAAKALSLAMLFLVAAFIAGCKAVPPGGLEQPRGKLLL